MTANPTESNTLTLTLAPGEKIEHYQVLEQVGSGGSSIVWKCYDAVSDRQVAIKQLLLYGSGEDDFVAQRFRHEAKMLRTLTETHPRLVKLYDFIDDQRGLFLITEFIEGNTLEQELATNPGPLEPMRALKIIYAAANVLSAIHRENVIHRDLKPSNLMVPKGGGLKVCDLGLATIMAEQEALPVGSVRYMAPELFTSDQAGPAADIYALGIIAYEMLAGRQAFDQAFGSVLRDQRNLAMRWMKWHTNFRAQPPPLHQLNPKVSRKLSELVGRMMRKDIDRRIRSAEELTQTISRHFAKQGPMQAPHSDTVDGANRVDGEAVDGQSQRPAQADPPTGQSSAWTRQTQAYHDTATSDDTATLPHSRRWPIYLGLAVVVGLLTISGALYAWNQAQRSAAINQAADQTREHLNEAQTAYQHGKFASARSAYRQAQAALPPPGSDFHDTLQPRVHAGLLLSAARLAMQGEDLEQARQNLEDLDQLDVVSRGRIDRLMDEIDRRRQFHATIKRIGGLLEDGQLDAAEKQLRQFIGRTLSDSEKHSLMNLRVQLSQRRKQAYVDQALARSNRLQQAGQLDEAVQSLERANQSQASSRLTTRAQTLRRRQTIASMQTRANQAADRGDVAQAISAYEQLASLSPTKTIQGRLNQLRSQQAASKGVEAFESGHQKQARAAFSRALGYWDQNAQARGYLSRMRAQADRQALIQAGDQAMKSQRYAAAIRQYESALTMATDPVLTRKLQTARMRYQLAQADQASQAGNLARARSAYQAALRLDAQAPGAKQGLAQVKTRAEYNQRLNHADRLREQGDFARAKHAYKQAAKVLDTKQVHQRLDQTEYEHFLAQGKAYMQARRWKDARGALRTAAQVKPTDEVRTLLKRIQRRNDDTL